RCLPDFSKTSTHRSPARGLAKPRIGTGFLPRLPFRERAPTNGTNGFGWKPGGWGRGPLVRDMISYAHWGTRRFANVRYFLAKRRPACVALQCSNRERPRSARHKPRSDRAGHYLRGKTPGLVF